MRWYAGDAESQTMRASITESDDIRPITAKGDSAQFRVIGVHEAPRPTQMMVYPSVINEKACGQNQ